MRREPHVHSSFTSQLHHYPLDCLASSMTHMRTNSNTPLGFSPVYSDLQRIGSHHQDWQVSPWQMDAAS